MTKQEMIALAREIAQKHGLDPALVCCVCHHESADWNTYAVRFEPAFLRRYIHPPHPEAPTTEQTTSAMSWGLMQVMGECAEEVGFARSFPAWHAALCDPALGLEFGCRILKKKLDAAGGEVSKGLLLYNGGGDPSYPGKVLSHYATYSQAAASA